MLEKYTQLDHKASPPPNQTPSTLITPQYSVIILPVNAIALAPDSVVKYAFNTQNKRTSYLPDTWGYNWEIHSAHHLLAFILNVIFTVTLGGS